MTDTSVGSIAETSGQYSVRSVARALDLLIELGRCDEPVGLTELARRTDLSPATALRLLETLSSRGFAQRDTDRGYGIGSRTVELGATFLRNIPFWTNVNKATERLAEITRETASIGILDGGEIRYLSIARGRLETGIASSPGVRHPVHCTSLGKAILAAMPEEEADSLVRTRHLRRLSANTITDIDGLHRDLDEIRRRGFSIDNEERAEGVVCIGAPFFDAHGTPIGAVSVSGSKLRMNGNNFSRLVHPVLVAAKFISTFSTKSTTVPGMP